MNKLHRQLDAQRQSPRPMHRVLAAPTAPDQPASHLLVVDDNDSLRDLLRASLEQHGYEVTTAADGAAALALLQASRFDLVLLDTILPRINGLHLCQQIRLDSRVPIILVSAMNREEDIVQGLETGADDYIAKPFVFNEVHARVMALLRRTHEQHGAHHRGLPTDIELDEAEQRALVCGEPAHLSPTEYRLLHCLVLRSGQPVARESLLRDVWDQPPQSRARILHTNIRRLRQKIETDPNEPRYIITVPGVGYKLNPTAGEAAMAS